MAGNGCLSFRREKFIEYGGPNGGNGGRGGDVLVEAVDNLNTLIDYRYQQHVTAQNGEHGMGKEMFGAYGDHAVMKVPPGTQIYEEDGETLICDLAQVGDRVVLLKGGNGASATRISRARPTARRARSIPASRAKRRRSSSS